LWITYDKYYIFHSCLCSILLGSKPIHISKILFRKTAMISLLRSRLSVYATLLLALALALLAACGGGGDGGAGTTPPGSLSLSGPARAVANTRYSYQASPADATVSAISWNWGDGAVDSSSSATVQKLWRKPGSFTVALQAMVSGQATSVSQTVVVTGAPLATGGAHSCALQPGGTVRCWGYNGDGELGNGSLVDSITGTVAVTGISNTVALSAGNGHTCALQPGGSVRCWGLNNAGQLGNGNTLNATTSVPVISINNAVALALGDTHSCALQTSGSVSCWGGNSRGQLGNGTTLNSSNAVVVTGMGRAAALVAGSRHTCALLDDGGVRCWGSNNVGQVGNGSTSTAVLSPTPVAGLSDVVALATGTEHSCALQSSGSVRCWGKNTKAQLGNGSLVDSATSVAVTGLNDAVALVAGGLHSCALQAGGAVRCWGDNAFGQLGNGTDINTSTTIFTVTGLSDAIALSAGPAHTCALRANGNLSCWGFNQYGQVGDGTDSDKSVPTPVLGGAIFWQ
jgi:alpha-tubulin suppressor-like RCC1 family protein